MAQGRDSAACCGRTAVQAAVRCSDYSALLFEKGRERDDVCHCVARSSIQRDPVHPAGRTDHAAARVDASSSASAISTATTREIPGSGIVMPTSWFAISIVILLCDMNRNCVSRAMS